MQTHKLCRRIYWVLFCFTIMVSGSATSFFLVEGANYFEQPNFQKDFLLKETSIGLTNNSYLTGFQFVLGQNKFAFYKENNLHISSIEGESSLLGADIKIKQNKKLITSKRYTYSEMPKNVLNNMKFSEGMGFYSALQSADENRWLFVERNMENTSYNLCLYNSEKSKEIIFSQDNSPDPNYAFMPIAWSNSKDVVYLEALIFGSATENEGIWSYNIVTKQFSRLSISPSYVTTPVISPDGEYFIYGGTTDAYKGLHSAMNIVFVYDIKNERERIVAKDNNSWFSISGWVDNNIEESDVININQEEPSLEKESNNSLLQPAFKLPWNSGVPYFVSRAGTPAPTGPIGSTIFTDIYINAGFQPHTYRAIDFDSPNGVYDPVRASAAGTVIYAQFNTSGYGNLVKIRHSDNTITYYAHLNTISVSVNDVVQQGCEIGDGGTTGNSTGDHIHFEWRDSGDAIMNVYPTFDECGCQPHANYRYTSNNSTGSCSGSACSNGTSTSFRNRDNGPPIHPPGSVLRTESNPTVYLIDTEGRKRPVSQDALSQLYPQGTDPRTNTNFTNWVIIVRQDELDLYEPGESIFLNNRPQGNGKPFPDGKLIKNNSTNEISIVTGGGKRRPFASANTFTGLGFDFCHATTLNTGISDQEYNSYQAGSPITAVGAMPLLTSSLQLLNFSTTGQTITGKFTIKNVGFEPVTLSKILISGRLNESSVTDFPLDPNIILPPGGQHQYEKSFTPTVAGSYRFFVAYQEPNGHWTTSVPAINGLRRTETIQINNAPQQISVNVGTSPAGGSFVVDGTTYTANRSFNWTSGSSHTIGTTSPQGDSSTRYNFTSWNDGNTQLSRTVSPTSNTTYLANFTTQHFLTMTAGTGGTVSPSSNWYNAGQQIQINAAPNGGYNFSSWSGSGSGSYSGANSSATITMNSPITQTANFTQVQCSYSINPTNTSISSNGGNGTVNVSTTSGCNWTAVSNVSWITVTGGSSGSSNGTVSYSVAQNSSTSQRQGTITIAGQTFTVTQNEQTPTCNYSVAPANINMSANSGTGNVTVSAPSGCAWTATANSSVLRGTQKTYETKFSIINEDFLFANFSDNKFQRLFDYTEAPPTWLTITSGTSGNGNGTVNYSFDQNSAEFRVGTITISANGQTQAVHTINQSAPPLTNVRKAFDFDGDGKSDISVFRPSNGAWYLQQSTNGFTGVTFGFGTDILVPADYDGDGKTDVAVFRPSSGGWYRINSSNGTFTGLQWGISTDIPIPADFDGDGKADINVFRPSDGGWYRLNSSTGAFYGTLFGQNGDKPLIANFDGDGKSDIAVFRPSTGAFYSLDSSTGNFRGVAFGFGSDIPTLGDFDGDGKTDVAVFRPSNGAWYRLNSSNNAFFGTLFGQNGDIPVTADYDGDGRADIAVFRPSNGAWYRLNSSNGAFVGQAFGFGSDKPIPSAFQ